jgi:hypothetical protein
MQSLHLPMPLLKPVGWAKPSLARSGSTSKGGKTGKKRDRGPVSRSQRLPSHFIALAIDETNIGIIVAHGRSFVAAFRTAASLTFPVSFRIVPSFARGENCGIGLERFLLSVSLRFC